MYKLILFTSSFPFGNKETYIEREIIYLSQAFEKIDIYPHYFNQGNKSCRKVPDNVEIHPPALPINKLRRIIQAFHGFFKGAKINSFFKEFFTKKIFLSKINFSRWLITLIHYLATVGSSQYENIVNEKNSILYYYWGFGWSFSILNFNRLENCKLYMRLHGSEVYLERSKGYIPLRNDLFKNVDIFLPISFHLANYLKTNYDISEKKIKVSRLGVKIPTTFPRFKNDKIEIIKLVSCSNIIKLKRIDLIVHSLKFFDGIRIKWVHFGEGPEINNIKKSIKEANFSSITIDFMGYKDNSEIIKYYKNNHIDAFINVSEHEGIPVSIMEAMSCKIPCIASDVGATSELINEKNGFLIRGDINITKIINALKIVIKDQEWKSKGEIAYDFCKENFNAEINYKKLISLLKNNIDDTKNI